jgi:hypothetical protein
MGSIKRRVKTLTSSPRVWMKQRREDEEGGGRHRRHFQKSLWKKNIFVAPSFSLLFEAILFKFS